MQTITAKNYLTNSLLKFMQKIQAWSIEETSSFTMAMLNDALGIAKILGVKI